MIHARTSRVIAACALLALACLLGAAAVSAHALLKSSDPSAGESLATSPSAITITFTEAPDPRLSTIRVLDSTGGQVQAGPVELSANDPTTLSVTVPALTSGVYTVSWRTVSSVDGHLATGSFAFGVGVAPPSNTTEPSSGSSALSAVSVAGRWVLYGGLLALLGACWMLWRVGSAAGRDTSAVRVLLIVAAAAAVLGTLAVLFDQLATAGVALADVPGTSFGGAIALRSAPLPVVILGIGLALRTAFRRSGLLLAAAATTLAMLADVALSHAAAGGQPLFDGAVQWLHIVAAGAWIGGLAALLVWLRYRTTDESAVAVARRFSMVASVSIGLVVVTGVLRAIVEIGTIDALFGTTFGWLVIAKSGLLLVLAGLGALNHFRHLPRGVPGMRLLKRIAPAELAVAAVVLLLTATLVNVAPPAESAVAATPTAITVSGGDFGSTVRVDLTVDPGVAGFDTFSVRARDYDSGAPISPSAVTLRFALPARPDVANSRLDLQPQADGSFSATGTNLSIDGTWDVTAVIAHGSTAVEVPLAVTTRIVRQPVDINRQPGLPTIYVVHLDAGRTVQMYLDPGIPGPNELHATFFDAAGNELPVPSATMSIGPEGQTPVPVQPRTLEAGHFVGDDTLDAGTYLLTVIGNSPDGSGVLVARADVEVSP